MIKVDNIVIEANQFPDHTLLVKAPVLRGVGELVQIVWNYENDAELFTLICLRKHYRQARAILWMDYCPHARMDRVIPPSLAPSTVILINFNTEGWAG